MADFVYRDYQYTIINSINNFVRAEVLDTTKSIYSDIPRTITSNNETYTVTSLANCFEGCALDEIPNFPDTIDDMSYCFYSAVIPYIPKFPKKVKNLIGCFSNTVFLDTDWEYFNFKNYIPETVIDMSNCFEYSNIDYCPFIPYSVKYLDYCFSNCNFPNSQFGDIYIVALPESCNNIFKEVSNVNIVTSTDTGNRTFWKNYALQNSNINIISSKVLSDVGDYIISYSSSALCEAWLNKTKYRSIPSSIKVDNTTYNVISLNDCFSSAINITTSPIIPSSVKDISYLFNDCSNLEGSIVAYNEPTSYTDAFAGTTKDIYIYSKNRSNNSIWRNIANQYNNVTFVELENALEINKDNNCIDFGQDTEISDDTVNFNWNTLLKSKLYINNSVLEDLIEQLNWDNIVID